MMDKDGKRLEQVAVRVSAPLREADARRCSGTPRRRSTTLLQLSGPADEALSRYFREHRELGQQERAFVAETVFAVLRRKRSLEAAAGSAEPQALVAAALLRVQGLSARALEGPGRRGAGGASARGAAAKRCRRRCAPTCPTGCGSGSRPSTATRKRCASRRRMLNPAPLDLRVNLARTEPRRGARAAGARRHRRARRRRILRPGMRLAAKPAINRHPLFRDGAGRGAGRGQPAARLAARAAARRDGGRLLRRRGRQDARARHADARRRPPLRVGRVGASAWRRSRRARRAPGCPTCTRSCSSGENDARTRAPGGQDRPRAGRRAVQRLRHAAAQSRPEVAPGAAGGRRAGREAGADPRSARRGW